MELKTSAGVITTKVYDDGAAKGMELLLDGETVCMLDVMDHPTVGGARLIVYSKYNEDEPTHIIEINKENLIMEFKTKLTEAFKTHMLMANRNYHTINELLYVLEHDDRFNGEDFNISISYLDGHWLSIPSLDAFVDIGSRGVWFNDASVVFEVEEFGEEKYNCITVYEREEI